MLFFSGAVLPWGGFRAGGNCNDLRPLCDVARNCMDQLCCSKKEKRADLQRKMDQLGQHPLHQSSSLGVSYTRKPQGDQSLNQGVGLDDIVLQPSPLGSTILVRRVSSAPGALKRASKDLEQVVGERASLLNGESGGDDLPAPP